MEIKKNDKFTVTIEDMGEDGAGIGRVDGYIWFVKDALIGDTIEASAMKMKKNYGFARLVRVITPAKGRVEAKCPVARACGGCQLQELDYKEQLKFKEKKVYNHLKRIGGMENLFLPEEAEQAEDIISSPAPAASCNTSGGASAQPDSARGPKGEQAAGSAHQRRGGTGSGSARRGRHGTDHWNGRPVEIPQQSAVPDRPRKRRKTDGGILCRTDPLPDPGTGAGLPAWMCGK